MSEQLNLHQPQENDAPYQIRAALKALEPLSDALSYKASSHLHRALMILENTQQKGHPV